MARKLLLSLIFDAAMGRDIRMFIKNSEPGMVKFTNQWYLFHRDGKFVLKNLEEGLSFETDDELINPINPDMIDAIKRVLIEEIGFHPSIMPSELPETPTVTEAKDEDGVPTLEDIVAQEAEEEKADEALTTPEETVDETEATLTMPAETAEALDKQEEVVVPKETPAPAPTKAKGKGKAKFGEKSK